MGHERKAAIRDGPLILVADVFLCGRGGGLSRRLPGVTAGVIEVSASRYGRASGKSATQAFDDPFNLGIILFHASFSTKGGKRAYIRRFIGASGEQK
jgi:hypothetical protein